MCARWRIVHCRGTITACLRWRYVRVDGRVGEWSTTAPWASRSCWGDKHAGPGGTSGFGLLLENRVVCSRKSPPTHPPHRRHRFHRQVYLRRLRKYLGAYLLTLGGEVDAIVFSAGGQVQAGCGGVWWVGQWGLRCFLAGWLVLVAAPPHFRPSLHFSQSALATSCPPPTPRSHRHRRERQHAAGACPVGARLGRGGG